MDTHNFTERLRKVLNVSRDYAIERHHEYVGTEHILVGLVREGEGVGPAVLQRLTDVTVLTGQIETIVPPGKATAHTSQDLPYTSRAKKTLELAIEEADALHHRYIGSEHLLLGLIREEQGLAAQTLAQAGVTLHAARAETMRILGSPVDEQ